MFASKGSAAPLGNTLPEQQHRQPPLTFFGLQDLLDKRRLNRQITKDGNLDAASNDRRRLRTQG
jgi:hypothetical protein